MVFRGQIDRSQEGATTRERLQQGFGALGDAGSRGVAAHFLQRKEEADRNEALKRLTGKDLSGLPEQYQKAFIEQSAKHPAHEMIVDSFVKQGVSPDDAQLYALLTTGGQTAFVKDLLEKKKRRNPFNTQGPSENQNAEMQEMGQQELSPEAQVQEDLQDLLSQQDEGLTPAERVKRQSERYKSNLPIFQEAGTRTRALARDKERIGILEGLEKTKKLPKNFGRLNVDEGGNLKFPFASSPEAQRYVKTLNEFTAGAKDTFGSRVTNFDLQQYLLRYPNLLNSAEGRKQIYEQMKIVNEINAIYYKTLKNVYDQAGGIRNIDPDVAESLAEKIVDPKIAQLVKKFDDIGAFPTLPDAASAKGRTIRNKETGELLRSDGTNWVPAENQ